ncbi:MAG: segregation/condensation protein A [Negativicutes bacterium]|jgi:segregation and condensation protein A
MNKHTFHLEKFQGPLDLLMHLLEKRKIDICDIPIAEITDQYLEYINSWELYNIEVASEFLLMAATLLQIKARMLLPRSVPIETEDDPRQELIDKLLEYQKFKKCAEVMNGRQGDLADVYTRNGEDLFVEVEKLPDKINLSLLLEAFQKIIDNVQYEQVEPMAEIKREEISVKRKIVEIFHYIKNAGRAVHFLELLQKHSRVEIIACFLAMLELIRVDRICVTQDVLSGEILLHIKRNENV